MGKIPLKDLARMMNLPEQDLMFKLKSIGVRLEGESAAVDSDIIQAILQGKRLPQPREVILRDDSGTTPAPRTKPMPRQPLRQRPTGRPPRRSMIQRVEQRIREIPVKEKGVKPPPEAAAAAAAEAAAAETPAPVQPQPPAPAEAPPAVAETVAASAPAAEAAAPPPAAKAQPPQKPPVAKDKPKKSGLRARARLIERPKTPPPPIVKEPPRSRRHRRSNDIPARRTMRVPPRQPAEEVEARKPASARGKRRAQRRQEIADGGSVSHFRDERPTGPVTITQHMSVREFAEKLGVKAKDLIKLLLSQGVMANINHVLDPEMALQLAEQLGVEAIEVTFEEEVQLQHEHELVDGDKKHATRAPVVTVMGHVDHGKTTLLDAIRQTKVVEGEAGGITQHIGAYLVDTGSRPIVFLDTPGHEAFTMMRARGAGVTDIVVLVVAADDGVMPQTIEAIDHARAAEVPIVVAINKVDKANANLDRVKKDLSDHGLLVEDWGGDIVAVPMSALKGEGIKEILEMILLTSDLLELRATPDMPAQGVILEARKEAGRGMIATMLVQDGNLAIGDVFVAGATWGRVRSMVDDRGQRAKQVGPSTPVEVTGFNDLPAAGDSFQIFADEGKARGIAERRSHEERQRELAPRPGRMSLEQLFSRIDQDEMQELKVIVKADVHGSVEVLKDTLAKLSTEKVKVSVIQAAVGAISTNDVVFASASDAIIVGFNVRPERNAALLAEKEQVEIRLHTVIYELSDELKRAMTGLLEPTFQEVHTGTAEIRQTFKVPKIGVVAGCYITDGVIPRHAGVRLLRDNIVVYEGKISSLRRFKDDASEVRSGFECGIGLEQFSDVKPGDFIEAFTREEVTPTL